MSERITLHSAGTALQALPELATKKGASLNEAESRLFEGATVLEMDQAHFFAIRSLCQLAKNPSAALMALLIAEKAATQEGSTFLSLAEEDLQAVFRNMQLPGSTAKRYLAEIPELFTRETDLFDALKNDSLAPFLFDAKNQRLFRQGLYLAEHHIAQALHQKNQQPWRDHLHLAEPIQFVTEHMPLGTKPYDHAERQAITLAPEQLEAAALAAIAPLTCISGGPGTGKTSVVITIMRILAQLGISGTSIGLAAPTGRAAVRMWESIRKGLASLPVDHPDAAFFQEIHEPSTLHRMLAWSPAQRKFRFDQDQPLPYDWLIIDEASMIDLNLAEQILDAAKPDAHLIFLGDADQLPAVEAGAFFRDLTQQAPQLAGTLIENLAERSTNPHFSSHVVQLRTSFRQSGNPGGHQVYEVSRHILHHGSQDLYGSQANQIPAHTDSNHSPEWDGVALLEPNQVEPGRFLEWLLADIFKPHHQACKQSLSGLDDPQLKAIFEAFNRFRLLCVTRSGNWGVNHLNSLLQKRLAAPNEDADQLPGLPLMVTRNDYALGLFNGDLGLLLQFQEPDHTSSTWLVFQDQTGFRRLRREFLSGLEPAYTMTVHKSQGTEANHIALVLPDRPSPLNRREVVYTALTRAKRGAWIYGSQGILNQACDTRMTRRATLAESIQ